MKSYYVHYSMIKKRQTIIFSPSDEGGYYNFSDDTFSDVCSISFTELNEFAPDFFYDLLRLCVEKSVLTFSVMRNGASNKEFASLVSIIRDLFEEPYPRFMVSTQIAVTYLDTLSSANIPIFVGSFVISAECMFPQSFNAETLKVQEIKRIYPIAKRISDIILEMNLDELSTIIWIDNWFQEHIQYIKSECTVIGGKKYICQQVNHQATVSDVLLNHYGVCEDISVSIAVILSLCHVEFEIVQGNAHAWIVVPLEGKHYIWDCTRNITRNRNRIADALQAGEYSNNYTLIGTENRLYTYPNACVLPQINAIDYPREKINSSMRNLSKKCSCVFKYTSKPNYHTIVELIHSDG